jgi:hypothetical protein
MKIGKIGCLFLKTKDNNILTIIYVNTNELRKKHPDFKLSYVDLKTKTMKKKPHSLNKIWFAIFDKNGRDFLSHKDFSNSAFIKQMKKISSEMYSYDDYPDPEKLYTKMKESGLDKFFTKKWFDKQYKFIGNQLKDM